MRNMENINNNPIQTGNEPIGGTLASTLTRIEMKLDDVLKKSDDHEKRLRVIEGKGGKTWDTVVGQVVSLIVAALMGWLIGGKLG